MKRKDLESYTWWFSRMAPICVQNVALDSTERTSQASELHPFSVMLVQPSYCHCHGLSKQQLNLVLSQTRTRHQEGSNRHPNHHEPLTVPLSCEMREPCHIAKAVHIVSGENLKWWIASNGEWFHFQLLVLVSSYLSCINWTVRSRPIKEKWKMRFKPTLDMYLPQSKTNDKKKIQIIAHFCWL